MITPTAEQRFQLLFSNGNRALAEAIRQAAPEQLELIKAGKGLKELLASLADDSLGKAKSDTLLLEILRNSPAFKQPGSFADTLKTLLQSLQTEPEFSEFRTQLQSFLRSVADAPAGLKRQVADSGIFLESKLLASAGNDATFSGDLKALLLRLQQELQSSRTSGAPEMLREVDRLLMQIDYHQLYSYLSNAAVLYFPYAWDLLEEGSLTFKKTKERTFYCRIELRLKRFGALHLLLALSGEKQIDIRARTEQPEFSELLRERLPELQTALRRAGLDAGRIAVAPFDPEPSKNYEGENGDTDLGFEVKI